MHYTPSTTVFYVIKNICSCGAVDMRHRNALCNVVQSIIRSLLYSARLGFDYRREQEIVISGITSQNEGKAACGTPA